MAGVLVYLIALGAAALIGTGVYRLLSPVTRLRTPVRWAGRAVACVAATLSFLVVFHVTGRAGDLSRRGIAASWAEEWKLGVVMGLGYTLAWFVMNPES